MKKFLRTIGPLFSILLFSLAIFVLDRELKAYNYSDIMLHIGGISGYHLLLALVLTILSYMTMTGYDALSLKYIRHPLAYSKTAFVSFISYAFSNNIGFAMIAGSSVRYRLYSAWGLTAAEIMKIIAFCSLTFGIGFLSLGSAVFLFEPMAVPKTLHLPFASVRPIGMLFFMIMVGYVFWNISIKKPLKIWKWEITLPSTRIFPIQIALASLDWALAGSILYVLLPSSEKLSFPLFLSIFLLAQLAGIISQVPGGIGVFESVVLMLLSPILPASAIMGSLLVFRAMFYIFPLIVAALLLGTHEMHRQKEEIKRVTRIFENLGYWVVPNVFAFTTFVSGAILLISGATPALPGRLDWINNFLPLPFIEISHFLGSIAGMGLLILARGIQRRLDAAYFLTMFLLGAGVIISLNKGFDYEEAILLSVMFVALLPYRRNFYRKASIFSGNFTPAWIAAIIIVLLGSVWIGFFSYKHIEYSNDLWWRFILNGDAPRFLRATIGATGIALLFAIVKLMRPAQPTPSLPGSAELDLARSIIERSKRTYANLALFGDKSLMFSESKNAFIMYSIEGRSWIAMGDPVGPDEECIDLVWKFHELCERNGGRTVFYEVRQENLHLYLDLGLITHRLGEEARIPLTTFSLEGSARKAFRNSNSRLERSGCTFDIMPAQDVNSLIPELKSISDAWLENKNTREKGFSLGFFDAEYLIQFPVAVVRLNEKIVAFANVWRGAEKYEISIDLMRYLPDAPSGVMDYLFIQLMLWGKQEGYQWLNMGMAPLSGLRTNSFSTLWNRVGVFVFRYGEHFYNFQGLREYKEKFDPEWKAKYIAYPNDIELPRIIIDLASLISGNLKGAISK